MEDNQNFTIRILVDALTKSLNELSQKITNYKPVLDRIGTQTDTELLEIKDIINQSQNILKNLDILTDNFFERTDTIINDLDDLKKTLEETTKTISTTNEIILNTEKEIKPIGKFTAFISKPFGLLIFIIGIFVASYTITTCWSAALEYFSKIKTTVQQQQQNNQ